LLNFKIHHFNGSFFNSTVVLREQLAIKVDLKEERVEVSLKKSSKLSPRFPFPP
jgi:hypothetical protein